MDKLWLPKGFISVTYKDCRYNGACSDLTLAAVHAIDYDTQTGAVRYDVAVGDQGTHMELMKCAGGDSDRYFSLPPEAAYISGKVNGMWCAGGASQDDILGVVYGVKGDVCDRDVDLSPAQTRQLLRVGACVVAHALSLSGEDMSGLFDGDGVTMTHEYTVELCDRFSKCISG